MNLTTVIFLFWINKINYQIRPLCFVYNIISKFTKNILAEDHKLYIFLENLIIQHFKTKLNCFFVVKKLFVLSRNCEFCL